MKYSEKSRLSCHDPLIILNINYLISRGVSRIVFFIPSYLIAILLRLAVRQKKNSGKDTVFFKKKSSKYTIFALDAERYRGDLDVLAKSDNFRVLHIKQGWQRLLTQVYLREKYDFYDVKNTDKSTALYEKHINTQLLIRDILEKLYRIINVDCITTVHFKYLPDYYWTVASEKLSIPHIMLYRECNLMSPIIYDAVLSMLKKHDNFHGSHIIVHNEKCKDIFVESNFAREEDVSVASALRMDELIKGIREEKYNKMNLIEGRKKFILFYFPVNSSMFGNDNKNLDIDKYYYDGSFWDKKEDYFKLLHEVILKLAVENKDIDFIIKPKENFIYEKSWDYYEKIVSESGINVKKLQNYTVDPHVDVHNLIATSSVVCGGQSSTTIESLILGKRVIIPVFYGYMDTEYFKQFPWRDDMDLFDTASDGLEFETVFYDAIKSVEISDNVMADRKELYLQCFNDFTGDSIGKYTEIITHVINR